MLLTPLLTFSNSELNRGAGVTWPSSLTDWGLRKSITINGAAKTADLTDPMSTTGNWTKTGTTVTVDDTVAGKAHWASTASTSTDRVHQALGFTLGDEFVVDFDFDPTSQSGNNHYGLISLTAGTGEPFGSTQDAIIVRYTVNTTAGQRDIAVAVKDGASAYAVKINSDNNSVLDGKLFYRLIRNNGKLILTGYYDSYRTETAFTISGNFTETISGLNTVIIGSTPNAAGGSLTADLDDVSVYNNTTTVENIPSKQTATYETGFDVSTGWTTTNATYLDVDAVTNNRLDFLLNASSLNEEIYRDLGAGFGSQAFVAQMKIHFTSLIHNSTAGNAATLQIGLSDTTTITAEVPTNDIVYSHTNAGNTSFNNLIKAADGSTSTSGNTGIDSPIYDDFDGNDIWLRIWRSGDTFSCQWYSDSSFETTTGDTFSVSKTNVGSLRYFFVRVFSQTVTGGNLIQGYIDDLEIFDKISEVNPATLTDYVLPVKIQGDTDLRRRVEPDYEDDFSTDKGWAEQGTQFTINAGTGDERIDFALKRDGASHEAYFDLQDADALGVGNNASDTAWCLRYHVKMTGNTSADAFNKTTYFGLYSSNGATTVPQDAIVIRITWGIDDIYSFGWEDNDDLNNSTVTNLSTAFTPTDDYYFEISRINASTARIRVFNDSAYSILVEELAITGISNVTNLRYIGIKQRNSATKTEVQNGWLDNVYFWDGITNPVTQETATFTDDFTGTDDWTDTGTGYGVDTVDDELDVNSSGDGNSNVSYFDLTSIDDKNWVWDFDYKFTSVVGGGNGGEVWCLITDNQNGRNNAQDCIGVNLRLDNGSYNALDTDSGTPASGGDANQALTFVTTTTYYFRVIRLSVTSYKVQRFSDSARTILVDTNTGTCTATTNGMRYIVFSDIDAVETGSSVGSITKTEFWNGVTSPNAQARKFVFTNDDTTDTVTEYSSETISYDPVNGDYYGNVRIPSLTTGADTTIQMYYNYNPSANPSYVPDSTIESAIRIDYNDDLTSESIAWSADTDDITYDGTGNEIDFNADGTASSQVKSLDLQNSSILGENLNDTNFLARITFNHTAFSTNSTSNQNMIQFGFGDANTDSGSAKDFIGFMVENDSSDGQVYYARPANGAGHANKGAGSQFSTSPSVTTHYVEFKRTSSSSCDVSIYSDADYSTLVETETITVTGITSLRYLLICTSRGASENGSNAGSIEKIQIWNGRTSPITREQSVYDSNYKAVYHLQGNSVDSTVYGKDGTDTSIDKWEQNNNDVGVTLDGTSDYITCGGAVADWKFMSNEFYFETWLLPNTVANNDIIFDSGDANGTLNGITIRFESTSLIRVLNLGGTDTNVGTGNIWNADELQHLAVRYDGFTCYIYKDGVEVARGSMTANDVNPSYVPRIGWAANGNDNKYDGTINKISIADKSRPSSVAITTYNAEKSDSDIITTGTQVTQ